MKTWREKEQELELREKEPDVNMKMWKLETKHKSVMLWTVLINLAL